MIRVLLLLLLCCLLPQAVAWGGPITVPAGLQPGDQYRLAFLTSTTTDATSTDISYYNAFVTNAANLEPLLQTLATTWTAIASTPTVAARDNTGTNPSSAVGVPVYGVTGQLIATSNADLWDGSISSPIAVYENGTPAAPGYTEAWTGTGVTGAPDEPDDPLGTEKPAWGDSNSTTANWIDTGGYYVNVGTHTLYAVSAPLTVVAGDVNRDGIANAQDIALLTSQWMKSGTGTAGDANGDNAVDAADIAVVSANWLQNAGDTTMSGMQFAAVPEPSTLLLALLGTLACLALRRR